MKPCSITIQMKAIELFFHSVLFFCAAKDGCITNNVACNTVVETLMCGPAFK